MMGRTKPRGGLLWIGRFALFLCATCLVACSSEDPSNLLRVDLRTDYTPGIEFDAVRLQIGDGDLAFRSDHLIRDGADFVRGERIDGTEVQPGPVPVTVTLYRSGAAVASRKVSAVAEAAITLVTVVMTRSCEGVECPNDNPLFDSCLGGECVDPRCTVETPEFCPDAFCVSDSECGAVACAEPRCEQNVCFSLPDSTRCASEERCDAILGCTPVDTVRDAGLDAEPLDAGIDANTADAGDDASFDAGMDAGDDAGATFACPHTDDDTVFLFDFESTTDAVSGMSGIHDGTRFVAGGSPCGGDALDVPLGLNHFRIPDRASFQLTEGSIDFWARLPAVTGFATILGRDASGRMLPGHLAIFYTEEGELIVRNQTSGMPMDSGACSGSGTVPPDTWVRIGVQFGPDRVNLFINGTLRSRTGSYEFSPGVISDCERPVTVGIAGNFNPYVVGANSGVSDEGTHLPIRDTYEGLQLDHLRLSSVRRDYATEVYP